MKKADQALLISMGEAIREARKDKRISQEELAYLADVTEQHISNIECGKSNTSILVYIRIMMALNLPFERLLAGLLDTGDSRPLLMGMQFDELEEEHKETVFQSTQFLMVQLRKNKPKATSPTTAQEKADH